MCEYNDGDLFGVCIALVALVFKRCHFMTWEKREDIRHSQQHCTYKSQGTRFDHP
jgi:hypothetical protein